MDVVIVALNFAIFAKMIRQSLRGGVSNRELYKLLVFDPIEANDLAAVYIEPDCGDICKELNGRKRLGGSFVERLLAIKGKPNTIQFFKGINDASRPGITVINVAKRGALYEGLIGEVSQDLRPEEVEDFQRTLANGQYGELLHDLFYIAICGDLGEQDRVATISITVPNVTFNVEYFLRYIKDGKDEWNPSEHNSPNKMKDYALKKSNADSNKLTAKLSAVGSEGFQFKCYAKVEDGYKNDLANSLIEHFGYNEESIENDYKHNDKTVFKLVNCGAQGDKVWFVLPKLQYGWAITADKIDPYLNNYFNFDDFR